MLIYSHRLMTGIKRIFSSLPAATVCRAGIKNPRPAKGFYESSKQDLQKD